MTDLYACPLAAVSYEDLRAFVLGLERADALTETAVLELKRERTGKNVVEAVAGMYNSDGGLVLVGVDQAGRGEQRFVGVPPTTLDDLVNQFTALLDPRGLMPEIASIALPSGGRVITVVRVPPGSEHVPVLIGGRALVRLPGQTVTADRRALLQLVARSDGRAYGRGGYGAFDGAHLDLWTDGSRPDVDLRLWGHVLMPPSTAERFRFGTARQDAVLGALDRARLTGMLDAPPRPGRAAATTEAVPWAVEDIRTVQIRVARGDPGGPASPHALPSGRVLLRATGPLLHWAVAVGASPALADLHDRRRHGLPERVPGESGNTLRWSPQRIHDLAALAMLAGHAAARAAADPPGSGTPTRPSPITGALVPVGNPAPGDVMDLDGDWTRTADRPVGAGYLEPSEQPQTEAEASALAKEWLADMLVDVGARDFESWLSELKLPE